MNEQPPNSEQNEFAASDINMCKIPVTFFKDIFAKTKTVEDLTLPELRDRNRPCSPRANCSR